MKDRLSKNMVVNLLMFVAMALTSISGYLIKCVIRRSTGIDSVLGLGRHGWREIHLWAGIVVVVLLAVHIFQHRTIIDAWFRKQLPHRAARIGVYITLIVLLAITIIPWMFM
jgi:predicted ferric reductase